MILRLKIAASLETAILTNPTYEMNNKYHIQGD
jgi:hypothetical protein